MPADMTARPDCYRKSYGVLGRQVMTAGETEVLLKGSGFYMVGGGG